MATQPRGSWTLDEAVKNRWDDYALDDEFKDYWTVGDETRYFVLHDQEANPNPPGPYCVFEKDLVGEPERMTGSGTDALTTEKQTETYLVSLTIHAKDDDGSTSLSAKDICIALAKLVATAFNDMSALDISPDAHVLTLPQPGFGTKEGDREYAWTLQYLITIEAEYDISPLLQ
jgi:hypothetical protein